MSNSPTTNETPSFYGLDLALSRAGVESDAAEAHGSLCGFLCGLGPGATQAWLAELLAEVSPPDAAQLSAATMELEALANAGRSALEDLNLEFQPLLPDDDEPLAGRVECLALWCQGFNHGLYVAARLGDAEAEMNSGNTAEIVADFAEMAQVSLGEDQPDADGESAYAELVEFIRVSVQLVYEELAPVRERLTNAPRH
jgi:uncharacterized protein YgfB (UPF0149 family)